MTDFFNKTPYLRTSRGFTRNPENLLTQLDKTFEETALAVNERTIGIYPTNKPAVTGNTYFVSRNEKQQSLRRIYPFTSAALSFNHGINLNEISGLVNIYGTATDGTNWYTLPHVDVTNANNQISITINTTQVVITLGAGTPPSITSGYVVIEYLSNP